MKIGMTSLTLRNESIENVIKYAKEAGIDGIEWGVSESHVVLGDEKSVQKIKELSDKYSVEIFSLGAYCRMLDKDECDGVIEAAAALNAPVIRIWAGDKSPSDCSEEYIDTIVQNTVYMAEKAQKYNIRLGFEYHKNTLTETAESAIALIKRINRENVRLYWQAMCEYSKEENLIARNKVLPYCVGNIHIQNYTAEEGYKLIEEIFENIYLYFNDIKNEDYNVMIEFVKDGSVENLKRDAVTLRSVIGQSFEI